MRIELDPTNPVNQDARGDFTRDRIASRLDVLAAYYLADAERHRARHPHAADAYTVLGLEAQTLAALVKHPQP